MPSFNRPKPSEPTAEGCITMLLVVGIGLAVMIYTTIELLNL